MIDLQIQTLQLNYYIKLNWKLYAKVIKRPSEGGLGLNRQCLN